MPRKLRLLRPEEAPSRPKNIVLTRKQQLYLEYMGQMEHLKLMGQLWEEYARVRTTTNINRITAAEIEHALRSGEDIRFREIG